MVRIDRIYTRGGDRGETSLGDGKRVSKAGARIAVLGALDETNAAIGLARVAAGAGHVDAMLGRIQNELFDLGADLCIPEDGRKAQGALRIIPAQVTRLEGEIDTMNKGLAPLTSFILPGGCAGAAHLHMARAIARRAETLMVALAREETINPAALCYINRLSDHLFVMARLTNSEAPANARTGDVLWIPGKDR